jgi:hypothetical protein
LSGDLPVNFEEYTVDGPHIEIADLEAFLSDAHRAGATRLYVVTEPFRRRPAGLHFFVDKEGF